MCGGFPAGRAERITRAPNRILILLLTRKRVQRSRSARRVERLLVRRDGLHSIGAHPRVERPLSVSASGMRRRSRPRMSRRREFSREKRLCRKDSVLFCAPGQGGALRRTSFTLFQEHGTMAKKASAPTKSEVLAAISKDTGLTRKQVEAVFDSLSGVMRKSLRSSGLFTVPGLMKLKVVTKPAQKAREGVNPFTGEKMMFKAKPASKKVRVLPLKNLRAMVN